MSITRTPQWTLYDSYRPENKMVNVGNSDSIILMLSVIEGAPTGFITFSGSCQSKEPNNDNPSSLDNFYTPIAVNDIDTGKTYDGSVGISVATARQVMLEVNSRFLLWLGVDDTFIQGAKIKIDYICVHQN